jgi:single-strand DNA-binding protein
MAIQVIATGNIGREPTLQTKNGRTFTLNSLASTRSWQDSDGNWHESTSWVNFIVSGKAAERFVERCDKGSPVMLEGELTSYTRKDRGENRTENSLNVRSFQNMESVAQRKARLEPQEEAPQGFRDAPNQGVAEEELPF